MYSSLHTSDTSNVGGGGIRMVNMIHLAVPAGFHIPSWISIQITGLPISVGYSYNYFVTRKDDKADFSIPGDTKTA